LPGKVAFVSKVMSGAMVAAVVAVRPGVVNVPLLETS
jgi:hypothetical protein